jgi:hypothetical protein
MCVRVCSLTRRVCTRGFWRAHAAVWVYECVRALATVSVCVCAYDLVGL